MQYEISQFYEEGNVRYAIQAKGKRMTYDRVVYLDGDQLLGGLHDCQKYDKKAEFVFPQIQVSPIAMQAVKEAFEKGWLSVSPTPITESTFRTTPINPTP